VRVPYQGLATVSTKGVTILVTSNGVEVTPDLANRCCIIRIRKRQGFEFRKFDEGDLLDHVQAKQGYYLGCVFAILRDWIQKGSPTKYEHEFQNNRKRPRNHRHQRRSLLIHGLLRETRCSTLSGAELDSQKDGHGSTSRQNRRVDEHVRDNGNWICADKLVQKARSRIRGSPIQARASREVRTSAQAEGPERACG